MEYLAKTNKYGLKYEMVEINRLHKRFSFYEYDTEPFKSHGYSCHNTALNV